MASEIVLMLDKSYTRRFQTIILNAWQEADKNVWYFRVRHIRTQEQIVFATWDDLLTYLSKYFADIEHRKADLHLSSFNHQTKFRRQKNMSNTKLPGSFPETTTDFDGPYHAPETLPIGKWHLMVNGRIVTLHLKSIDADGSIDAVYNTTRVEGRYDKKTQKLTFTRPVADIHQNFEGYLCHFDKADYFWRLAGILTTAENDAVGGWYGTLSKEA